MEDFIYYFVGFFYGTKKEKRQLNIMDYYNINLMVDDLSVCITKAFDLLDSDYVEEKFYSLQKNEMIALCRGFVDRRSELYEDSFGWNVRLEDPSGAMEQCLNSFGIAHSKQVDDDSIVFSGPNAFDLLSLLYGYSKICYSRKDPQPSEIIISVAGVTNEDIPKVKVFIHFLVLIRCKRFFSRIQTLLCLLNKDLLMWGMISIFLTIKL